MAAELCIIFGKILRVLGFLLRGDFTGIGGDREVLHRAGVGPTREWALGRGRGPPLACVDPLESPFWLPSLFLE